MSNKSEATWYPNLAPEVPNVDLIAEARDRAAVAVSSVDAALLRRLADALAALRDTVPRGEYRQANTDWRNGMLHVEAERDALQRGVVAATERAEAAEAERYAIAHVIEQARAWCQEFNKPDAEPHSFADEMLTAAGSLFGILATAPAVSLALHDAEVAAGERQDWADYLEHWGEAVGSPEFSQERVITALRGPRPFGRAAAIREEAK